MSHNAIGPEAIGPGSLVASRFRLEDLLEEHSGARFWRATDLTLARNVAIHVIPADDPRAAALLTAARTSATVSDGHILRVLDAVEEGDLVYVIHEWGSGVSLDRLLAEETLDPRRAAWLTREVAEAITVAHRHGIAHGRLLPESVMLTDAGSVKLVGFVVAAVLHGRPQRSGSTGPPPSEHESDVLNLGALLYACLTGRWPGFPQSVLPDAPTDHGRTCRPRQVRPGVPKTLDSLCEQILARRFESAEEVGRELDAFLGDSLGTASLPISGPTAFLDPAALRSPATAGTLGSFDGVPHSDASRDAPVLRQPQDQGTGSWTAVPPDTRPGTRWLRRAAVVGVLALLALALVVALSLGRSGPSDEGDAESDDPSPGAPSEVLTPEAVSDFDPDGGAAAEENADLVPLAVDGDPATSWETKTYFDGPVLSPYRSGVGLLLDLGAETDVGEVTVSLVGGPYDLALLAAPEGSGTPVSVDGLTELDSRSGVSGEVAMGGEDAVRTRYLVVWLTSLPAGDDGYRGAVAEVVVRS